jgi:hypothetical protein
VGGNVPHCSVGVTAQKDDTEFSFRGYRVSKSPHSGITANFRNIVYKW